MKIETIETISST